METATLNIPNIHCDGRLSGIQMMLGDTGAVSDVDGDLNTRIPTVAYDPWGTTPQGLVGTVKDIGFPPRG